MTPEELTRAETALAGRPEYDWLILDRSPWRNLSEVARGMGLSRNTVRDWCERGVFPGAVNYGPEIGWRVPRSALIEYYASRQAGQERAV